MKNLQKQPNQYCSYWASPLGLMRLDCVTVATDLVPEHLAISGMYFENQKYFPHADTACEATGQEKAFLQKAATMLERYFAGKLTQFDIALAPSGTDFQKSVWKALLDVAHGQTISYAELSNRIGNRAAIRAAAAAVGKNPISIVIPCHRIIGSNGSLTGYAGGLDRKAHLLALESRQQPLLV